MVVARNRRISDDDSDGRMLIDFTAALDLDGADDDIIYDSLLLLLLVNWIVLGGGGGNSVAGSCCPTNVLHRRNVAGTGALTGP